MPISARPLFRPRSLLLSSILVETKFHHIVEGLLFPMLSKQPHFTSRKRRAALKLEKRRVGDQLFSFEALGGMASEIGKLKGW